MDFCEKRLGHLVAHLREKSHSSSTMSVHSDEADGDVQAQALRSGEQAIEESLKSREGADDDEAEDEDDARRSWTKSLMASLVLLATGLVAGSSIKSNCKYREF